MIEVRTFADRFTRRSLTDIERVLPVDGQLSALRESLTGMTFDTPAQPTQILRVSFYGIGDPPAWLESTVGAIAALGNLDTNWDSYGARPVEVESMINALEALSWALTANSREPAVVPGKRGNVQLEWRDGGSTLDIAASKDGSRAYYNNDDTGEEWETYLAQDPDKVMAALRTFRP